MPDGVALNSKLDFAKIDWKNDYGDKAFWGVTAIPHYDPVSAPFAVAVNPPCNKVLLLNTVTGATITLAILKQNHQSDSILPDSIKISVGEESKSAIDQNLIVHFVTSKFEKTQNSSKGWLKYYNQVRVSSEDLELFRATNGDYPKTIKQICHQTIENNKLKNNYLRLLQKTELQ